MLPVGGATDTARCMPFQNRQNLLLLQKKGLSEKSVFHIDDNSNDAAQFEKGWDTN
jgi:hypothetical protein